MAIRIKGEKLRAACAKLRAYLAAGDSDHEICEKMGLSWGDYEELKGKMMAFESAKVVTQSSEQVYVEYLMNQEKNIHALSTMIDSFQDSRQHAAMVGAVKARADIYDKMIKTGQEFGFIEKMPERTEIVAGVMVRDLSEQDLRAHITSALSSLDTMQKKYGDSSNIIDLDPGQTHFPDPKPQKKALAAGGKTNHRSQPVHKGRRVVKEKVEV